MSLTAKYCELLLNPNALTALVPFGSLICPNLAAETASHMYTRGYNPFCPVATIVLSLFMARAVISSVWPFNEVSTCFLCITPVSPPPKYF